MFEQFDFDYLMDAMLAEVSDDLDKREGSVIWDALAPAAMRLYEFYIALDMAMNEVFADTASYYYLIKRAAERGILPYEATCAIARMVVTPADVGISIGDRFNLNELNYTVTSVIDASKGEYQLTCETEGTAANQQMGDLIPIQTSNELNNMESAKITEILIPGEDEEDVEAFRQRYYDSFHNEAYGGNKADYIDKVNAIDGVGACNVYRRWNGEYHPANFIPSDAVSEWFSSLSPDKLGSEVYEWIRNVYNAAKDKLLTVGGKVEVVIINSEFNPPSDVLVKTVQETLDPEQCAGEGDGVAPIGHVVKVRGVDTLKIDVALKDVEYNSGYSFDNMKSSIEEVIDSYFAELRKSWPQNKMIVRVSQIETRLLDLKDGIVDIGNIDLNGFPDNVLVPDDCVPVRGDVSG